MLTEDRFKDLLNAELDASPGPPMPGIADRAAAGGRRRARRRRAAAAAGTALAVGILAGGITVVSALGPSGASVAGPAAGPSASATPQEATLQGDPRFPEQPVPDNPLAAQLRPAIEQLLPGGTKTTRVYTGRDGGIYATVDWQTGQGLVEVVVGLVGKQWFGCELVNGRPTPVEGNYGQCVLTNGTLVGTYGGTSAKTGLQNRRFEAVSGGTMVTLSYANGTISDNATPTQPQLPLTDEQGIGIVTSDAWRPLLTAYVPLPPAPTGAPTRVPSPPATIDLPPLTSGSHPPASSPPAHR